MKLNPEKVQPLAEVEAQINSQLTQQAQQEAFSDFVADYQSKWTSRTFCAAGFVIERCSNSRATATRASAPPACYEADPKGGPPKACPAPVAQVAPGAARHGHACSNRKGERLPQRPRPEGLEEAAEEALPNSRRASPPAPTPRPTGE